MKRQVAVLCSLAGAFIVAVHTNPNDALANARIGICLGQLERLNDSIPYLLKASALDPTDSD